MSDDLCIFITKKQEVYGMGNTDFLGLNTYKSTSHGYDNLYTPYIETFIQIACNIKVKDIAVGKKHIILLDTNNKVYICGNYAYNNRSLYQFTPVFSYADQIFATEYNSFLVLNENLYAYSHILGKYHATFTLIGNVHHKNNTLKKIIVTSKELFFLYNNGDAFIFNSNNNKILINTNIDDLFLIEYHNKYKFLSHDILWLSKDSSLSFICDYLMNTFIKNNLTFYTYITILIEILFIKCISEQLFNFNIFNIVTPVFIYISCRHKIPVQSYIKYLAYNLALFVCQHLLLEKIANSFMPMVSRFCSTLIVNKVQIYLHLNLKTKKK